MKKVVAMLVLLALLVVASFPVAAAPVVKVEPCAVPESINAMPTLPWAGVSPTVQPKSLYYCCKCRTCMYVPTLVVKTKCYCGYFSGCGGSYPACGAGGFSLYTTCNCP